jgi:DNA-binding transcriptional ArsR family regulator
VIAQQWEPARKLTRAQFRVVALLYHNAMSYPMIAEAIGISIRTVRHHIASAALWLPGHGDPAWKVLRHADKLLELGYTDDSSDDEEAA